MAEETPDNLGSFGGFTAGRAVDDNRGIDRATDRLEKEIDRLADSLERLTAGLSKAQQSAGGTQQSTHGNGGNVTFSAAHSTGQASYGMAPTGGSHRAQVPGAAMVPRSAGRVAAAMSLGAVGASALYAANHFDSQTMGANLMGMAAGAGGQSDAAYAGYRQGMMGNYTAHGSQDHWATQGMLVGRSGFLSTDQNYRRMAENIYASSATNPMITNVQAGKANMSLSTTTSVNRMSRLGINPLGAAGRGDPIAVARQLLNKIGVSRVRTKQQAAAAFAPTGSATVTLDSFVVNGYLPAEARDVVESHMKNMLFAQVSGIEQQEYQRLATAANNPNDAGSAARERLEAAGIATQTPSQRGQRKEGTAREAEVQTIRMFTKGLTATTDVLTRFREGLNKVLQIPGVGESVGLFGGVTGGSPLISGIMSKFSGGGSGIMNFLGGGDGRASMSSGQMMYAGATGGGGSAGFGTANARTTASSGSAQGAANRYSLGPVKPWVAKAASILGPMFGIGTIGGVAQRSTPSDHPKGLALDFMCGKSAGDSLAAYAVRNHKSLNITYVIWRQRIWSINNPRWQMMEDRGSITANHYDHVHISFLASPTNGDFSGMPSGGVGGSMGGGKGNLNAQGASSPDNGAAGAFTGSSGYNAAGRFSEVAALGLGAGGVGMSGGGISVPTGGGGLPGGGGGGRGGGGLGGASGLGGYGSGAAGTVRSGTYNVGSLKGRTNPAADVEKLIGPADVLALTEVNPQRLAALRRGLADDNWGVYAGDGSARGSYALDASIAYDKDKYQLVKGGTYKLGDLTGNFLGGRGKRYANYALLKDKDSGMAFWQVAAHTVPMANADMAHRKMHKEQFDSLDQLAEMLQKTGIPVIMGGDFNQQRDRDFWRNPSGMSSARGGGVDHVFGQSGAVKTSALNMIGGLSGDHSGAVLATMSIAGSSMQAKGNGGSPQQNIALGRAMAAQRGWTGAQWAALKQLWQHESGWRTNADNPTSSAYGIPQALTQLHGLGEQYMKDPKTQIQWGLNYIAGRYGTPGEAWDFWQRNNYYKQGAWKVKENAEAQIHMGEMILPSKIADLVRDELAAPGIRGALGSSRGRGGNGEVSVVFREGAIQVTLMTGDEDEARHAGKRVVDAMMEDKRFRDLAEG